MNLGDILGFIWDCIVWFWFNVAPIVAFIFCMLTTNKMVRVKREGGEIPLFGGLIVNIIGLMMFANFMAPIFAYPDDMKHLFYYGFCGAVGLFVVCYIYQKLFAPKL